MVLSHITFTETGIIISSIPSFTLMLPLYVPTASPGTFIIASKFAVPPAGTVTDVGSVIQSPASPVDPVMLTVFPLALLFTTVSIFV